MIITKNGQNVDEQSIAKLVEQLDGLSENIKRRKVVMLSIPDLDDEDRERWAEKRRNFTNALHNIGYDVRDYVDSCIEASRQYEQEFGKDHDYSALIVLIANGVRNMADSGILYLGRGWEMNVHSRIHQMVAFECKMPIIYEDAYQ